ncbi:glycosyltransferase family 4 protein [Paraburkholderia atlantica]|uniref:glycosyltransferase family 4 protein n=1 Tax=Paraburkholderia atlantica TaxID=2654982 RepID=UPI00035DBDB0|nr:glycosyltransferase family 1 protein [Paraburkholderia atlantica]
MKSRIVVNITASVNWRRRPVGIIRVERELIKQINRLHANAITPVFLDARSKTFKTVSHRLFDLVIADEWVLSETGEEDGGKVYQEFSDFRPASNDKFVTVGSDWSFDIPDRVEELYRDNKVLIPALYDLIPLLFPEFTPGPEFFEQFNRHYANVARLARSVFSISEHSKSDLLDFWKRIGVTKGAPHIDVVPLAGLKRKEVLPELDKADRALLDNVKRSGEYVIFVSTLEPRKNHQLMLDIWRELHIERGSQCPLLLFVGMRGWGSDNMIQQMSQMNATSDGKVLWLQGVGDNLLSHLYANCAFAVLPSHYEGWGLAATEAAAFGKVCVVSSSSALSEATGGLTPAYHPLDFPGWAKELRKLIDDAEYRGELEKRISENFVQRTWDDFGDEFSARLL